MSRIILGIDPGTRFCGYGVIEVQPSTKPRYIECGVLQFTATLSLSERLKLLASDLRDVIADLKPQEMALESVFYGKNVQSALRLGYARGVIMLLCAEANLSLHEYAPALVKQTVAGHGRATKEDVQRMVKWQCSLQSEPAPDAADALALALCHAVHSKGLAR